MHRIVLMTTAALAVGCNPTNQDDSSPASHLVEQEDSLRGGGFGGKRPGRTVIAARPCRGDTFFIDVPLNQEAGGWNPNFRADLQASLNGLLANRANDWFCEVSGCLKEPIVSQVEGVLNPRPTEAFREDGHLRFFRVSFIGETSEKPQTVLKGWACDAVSSLRNEVSAASWAPPETFYVGRECDAAAMSVEASATPEMLAWHTRMLGLPDTALAVGAPPADMQNVDLAIIDTGIDSQVASTLGVATNSVITPSGSGLHPHGTGMSLLARQVAPEAALHSYQVMQGGGMGTSLGLTRALDRALYLHGGTDEIRPLVINLSLGWPSQLSRHAQVRGYGPGGTQCTSWEDPFGESVRYMLDVAHRLDQTGDRQIFVSVAAGNRPMDVDPNLFPPAPSTAQTGSASCTNPTPVSDAWFYPGELFNEDSCRPNDAQSSRLAFTTSPINDVQDPSAVGMPNLEAPLVAPGEHVMTGCPAGLQAACAAQQLEVSLAATFSGSSVSAVLAAGAASLAQNIRLNTGLKPLSQHVLGRMLYLTGRDVCDAHGQRRISVTGAPVRRLDVARLDHAMRQDRCEDLVQCARAATGVDIIGASLLFDCAQPLETCRLEELNGAGQPITMCEPSGEPLRPPLNYSNAQAYRQTGTPTVLDDTQCALQSCADKAGIDRHLLGSFGPQPAGDGCPWCFVAFDGSGFATVHMELSSELPASTQFSDPWLILTGLEGSYPPIKHTVYVDLMSVTDPGAWAAGEALELEIDLTGENFEWSSVKAKLSTMIATPDSDPAEDISPMVTFVE